MALVTCDDCGHEVSTRAQACPNCGAPVAPEPKRQPEPDRVSLDGEDFVGTKALITRLAAKAVLSLNYRVDNADETSGLVTFTTGVTMGSWSGVSGSVYLEEVAPNRFRAKGAAKQNVRGGQVLALDLFGEAGGKVQNVIREMRRLATPPAPVTTAPMATGRTPPRPEFPVEQEQHDKTSLAVVLTGAALVIGLIGVAVVAYAPSSSTAENVAAAAPANDAAAAPPSPQPRHHHHARHHKAKAAAPIDTNENMVDGEIVHRLGDNWVTDDGRVMAPAGD